MSRTRRAVLVLALAGCATAPRISPEQAAAVRKVAVLSMTMDALGEAQSDWAVQGQALQAGFDGLGRRLGASGRFEIVDLRGAGEAVTSFSWPTRSRAYAAATQGMDPGLSPQESAVMAALMGGQGRVEGLALNMLEQEQDRARTRLVGVGGLPVVPLAAVTAQTGTTSIEWRNGQRVKSADENKRELVYRAAGALAAEVGVDALLIVSYRAALAGGGTRVYVGDRGLDTVKMAAGYVLVSRDGQALVDVAPPVLDDLAPMRLAVPVYRKVGNDRQVDLADRQGAVAATLSELADSLTEPVAQRLVRELSPGR